MTSAWQWAGPSFGTRPRKHRIASADPFCASGRPRFRKAPAFGEKLQRVFLLSAAACLLFLCFTSAAAQTCRRTAAKTKNVPVQVIDFEGLKRLIARDPAARRPLLVNFWATWCDPCRDEFPDLVRIDSHYRTRGLEFITVSLDDPEELTTGVPSFLRQMRAYMPAFLLHAADPGPAILYVDEQWSGSLPATFLFDPDGKVTYKRFGRIQVPELRAAIDKLVGSGATQ